MNTIVRSLIVALAVSGAIATSYASTSTAHLKAAKASAAPMPTCPPSDPSGCGGVAW